MPESRNQKSDQPNSEALADEAMNTGRLMDRRAFMSVTGAAVVGTTLVGRVGNAAVPAPRLLPRLLADNMLARSARWLRAAGYDTAVPSSPARRGDLMDQAVGEDRIIISSDRGLTGFADAPGRFVLIADQRLPQAAAELTARLGIDWLRDPFTRCLLCNFPVEVVDPAILWPAPNGSSAPLADVLPLTRCASCDQLYWRGGHARRMRARLEAWSAGRFV